MKFGKYVSIFLFATLGCSGEEAKADGVHIGRFPSGQIATEVEAGFTGLIHLPAIQSSSLFNGWSDNNPGFTDTLDADVSFLPLEPGANIWLEIVSVDPALVFIDAAFQKLQNPGDDTLLGSLGFDTHLTFLIDADDPSFDVTQAVWDATFFIRDDGSTSLASSDPVTLSFTNVVPEPTTFIFLLVIVTGVLLRSKEKFGIVQT